VERIVSLGAGVTEILFALGAGPRVVARDGTSLHPEAASQLPSVGYRNGIGAEGILTLRPTLVIGEEGMAPDHVIQQLQAAGIRLVQVPGEPSVEGVRQQVRAIAAALEVPEAGETLIREMDADLARLQDPASRPGAPTPSALILYLRGNQATFVCGPESEPGSLLTLAGGTNAARDIRNCTAMTAESVVLARPEVLLVYTRGMASVGGLEGLLALPGVAQTPAGRARRVVVMDDLYLGSFGIRSGRAAVDLRQALLEGTGVVEVEAR
jgi:iron complex transport system substrate-binding protein